MATLGAVLEVRAGLPVSEAAGRHGMSCQSVHSWVNRYREEGPSGLVDRSHNMHRHPGRIPPEVEAAVCELRRAHPRWGPDGRIVIVTATSTTFEVSINGQAAAIVPRTTSAEIHRYKATGGARHSMSRWDQEMASRVEYALTLVADCLILGAKQAFTREVTDG